LGSRPSSYCLFSFCTHLSTYKRFKCLRFLRCVCVQTNEPTRLHKWGDLHTGTRYLQDAIFFVRPQKWNPQSGRRNVRMLEKPPRGAQPKALSIQNAMTDDRDDRDDPRDALFFDLLFLFILHPASSPFRLSSPFCIC
jgi:hypothetical protein